MLELNRKIKKWQESAERVDQLHKQDLLYYNIIDFVTTRPDAATKVLLDDKYTIAMNHFKSLHAPSEDVEKEVNLLMCKNLTAIEMKENEICKAILRVVNKQFKDDTNTFTDPSIGEYHFTSAFVFPLFDELFDDISRKSILQKWGESKLMCAKEDEHNALNDGDRRTPGPSIDAIFSIPAFDVAFVILEISRGPACDDFKHYLGV
ncbi:hypothetical protein EDC96DRAFT_501169 [Choanephora cucurbitarum]|nr:hypothetical protein EDC96DRAFT_501169 [Choanephora cucurbitarum]